MFLNDWFNHSFKCKGTFRRCQGVASRAGRLPGRGHSLRRSRHQIRDALLVRVQRSPRGSVPTARSESSFCVRTGSHRRHNPGATRSFTGTRRDTSLLRKVVDRKCVGGSLCASARANGINFQACSFIRLRSRASSARATARCPAEAAQPRRWTTLGHLSV